MYIHRFTKMSRYFLSNKLRIDLFSAYYECNFYNLKLFGTVRLEISLILLIGLENYKSCNYCKEILFEDYGKLVSILISQWEMI